MKVWKFGEDSLRRLKTARQMVFPDGKVALKQESDPKVRGKGVSYLVVREQKEFLTCSVVAPL
jgi:hypothetical protein